MKLFNPGGKLFNRVIHAGLWTVLLYGTARIFGLARTMVVARILAPDDIGLFALASLVLLTVETFTESGFSSAIINREGDIERDLDVSWTVHAMRGFGRAGIIVLISPFAARFFESPQVEPLGYIVAVATLVNGFTNTGVINFTKHLEFHKESLYSVSRLLAEMVVTIVLAVYLKSASALAYGFVAGHAVQVLVSWAIHPFRPRPRLDRRVFEALFRYGVWMNVTGIMIFLANHGASLVVGKVLSTGELGLYHMGHWITQSALVGVAFAFGTVAFSAYSKIQGDKERLKAAFIKMAGFTISIAVPVSVAIVLLGEALVRFALGDKWVGMVEPLRILSVAGCLHAIGISGRPVFLGLGRPRSLFHMQCIRAATLLATIYPLAYTAGISGAALSMVISTFAAAIFWWIKMRDLLRLNLGDFRQLFGPSLVAVLGVIPVLYLLSYLLTEYCPTQTMVTKIVLLAGALVAGALTYLLILGRTESWFPTNKPMKVFRVLLGKSDLQ